MLDGAVLLRRRWEFRPSYREEGCCSFPLPTPPPHNNLNLSLQYLVLFYFFLYSQILQLSRVILWVRCSGICLHSDSTRWGRSQYCRHCAFSRDSFIMVANPWFKPIDTWQGQLELDKTVSKKCDVTFKDNL